MIQAETIRLLGDLLRSTGDPTAAEVSYVEALALARRQSAKLWELRSATSLARLWHDQGRCAEARDLLAPVYDWFTEGFDTQDLQGRERRYWCSSPHERHSGAERRAFEVRQVSDLGIRLAVLIVY